MVNSLQREQSIAIFGVSFSDDTETGVVSDYNRGVFVGLTVVSTQCEILLIRRQSCTE